MSLLVQDIVKMGTTQLAEAGSESAALEAEILYCYMRKIDRARFIREWSLEAEDRFVDIYFDLIRQRCGRRPLQYIVGSQDFMGLEMAVSEGVLIPRQDTEPVAEQAVKLYDTFKGDTVLDLCCGCGCIGIYLAKKRSAKVTACDISAEAAKLTAKNADKQGVRLNVLTGDLFEPVRRKKYHMIVCNPPYIESAVIPDLMPEVRDFEPHEALDGGEDGLDFYRRIAKEAPEHLKKKGVLLLEIGSDQRQAVEALLEETGSFGGIESGQDLAGLDRWVSAIYTGR